MYRKNNNIDDDEKIQRGDKSAKIEGLKKRERRERINGFSSVEKSNMGWEREREREEKVDDWLQGVWVVAVGKNKETILYRFFFFFLLLISFWDIYV